MQNKEMILPEASPVGEDAHRHSRRDGGATERRRLRDPIGNEDIRLVRSFGVAV